MKEMMFIKEEIYQRIKKELEKEDDYFTLEDLENIRKKIGVKLA